VDDLGPAAGSALTDVLTRGGNARAAHKE